MMARNFATGRAPAWAPTIDCLRAGRPALHLVEVPLSAYLAGGLWRVCGGSLDVWGRATTIAFSAASVALLYVLARRWHSPRVALVAGLVLAVAPVSVVYGQSFMLEPSVVALSLAALLSWDLWLQQRGGWWWTLWCLCLAALLLSKIYMAVLLLPMAAIAWRQRLYDDRGGVWRALAGSALAVAPAVAWCLYVFAISRPEHPRSGEVYFSLATSADAHGLPHPLLTMPSFYARLVANLATFVLTPIPLLLACAAMLGRNWRRHGLWLAAMLVLVVVLPRKFHEQNYYYLVVLPPLAMLAGLGFEQVTSRWRMRPSWLAVCLLVTVACSVRYSLRPVFVTPWEDRGVVAAAHESQRFIAPDEPVVTMHGSTIDLLYHCDRRGWAISPERSDLSSSLAACQRHGARVLVVADLARVERCATARAVLAELPVLVRGDDFRVYRLEAATEEQIATDESRGSASDSAGRLADRAAKSNAPHAPGTR